MSIDEIAAYCKAPTPARFLEIASAKEEEIGPQNKKRGTPKRYCAQKGNRPLFAESCGNGRSE